MTAKHAPDMFKLIEVRAHGGPGQGLHRFLLEVICYSSSTMRSGVVIHVHRPGGKWVVVEMGHDDWLKDLSDVPL